MACLRDIAPEGSPWLIMSRSACGFLLAISIFACMEALSSAVGRRKRGSGAMDPGVGVGPASFGEGAGTSLDVEDSRSHPNSNAQMTNIAFVLRGIISIVGPYLDRRMPSIQNFQEFSKSLWTLASIANPRLHLSLRNDERY